MASRMRRPETVRIEISGGDFLILKKRLTYGEQRRVFARMVKSMVAGQMATLDPLQVGGFSLMLEYLLDWSLVDPEGRPIVIRDQGVDVIERALDALDPDGVLEIKQAVEAHVAAMEAEVEQEKNAQAGASASPATSPSAA